MGQSALGIVASRAGGEPGIIHCPSEVLKHSALDELPDMLRVKLYVES